MNKDNIENLIHSLSSVKMTRKEKSLMQRQLLAFTYAQSTPSPYQRYFVSIQKTFALALVLVLAIGSITKPASAGALPGDFLYAVKIMHEEIQAATINAPEKKVTNEIKRTETRIKEATLLAKDKGLDKEKKEKLAKDIKKHTDKVKEEIAEVKVKDPLKALELNNQFKVSMESNVKVLKDSHTEKVKEELSVEELSPKEELDKEELDKQEVLETEINTTEQKELSELKVAEVSPINELDLSLDDDFNEESFDDAQDDENIDSLVGIIEADLQEAQEVSKETQEDIVDIVVRPAGIQEKDSQEENIKNEQDLTKTKDTLSEKLDPEKESLLKKELSTKDQTQDPLKTNE